MRRNRHQDHIGSNQPSMDLFTLISSCKLVSNRKNAYQSSQIWYNSLFLLHTELVKRLPLQNLSLHGYYFFVIRSKIPSCLPESKGHCITGATDLTQGECTVWPKKWVCTMCNPFSIMYPLTIAIHEKTFLSHISSSIILASTTIPFLGTVISIHLPGQYFSRPFWWTSVGVLEAWYSQSTLEFHGGNGPVMKLTQHSSTILDFSQSEKKLEFWGAA